MVVEALHASENLRRKAHFGAQAGLHGSARSNLRVPKLHRWLALLRRTVVQPHAALEREPIGQVEADAQARIEASIGRGLIRVPIAFASQAWDEQKPRNGAQPQLGPGGGEVVL